MKEKPAITARKTSLLSFGKLCAFFYYFRFVLVAHYRLPRRNEFCARNVIADFGEKNRSKIALSKFDFSNNKLEKIIAKKVLVEKP